LKPLFALFLLPCCALAQDISTATEASGPEPAKFEVKANHQPPSFDPNPAKAVVFIA
jgi:hypothetical protein